MGDLFSRKKRHNRYEVEVAENADVAEVRENIAKVAETAENVDVAEVTENISVAETAENERKIEMTEKAAEFIDAAWRGDRRCVEDAIRSGVDVNVQDWNQYTALIRAAWQGHLDIVKALIDANADVNVRTEDQDTALIKAAWEGHLDIVKALIDANADVNFQGGNQDTALIRAVRGGHLDIVKALIDANADVNIKGDDQDTALIRAVWGGHLGIVKALVSANADVTTQLNDYPALHHYSAIGNLEIVAMLLDHKVDPNAKNDQGLKPIYLAALNGRTETVKALLEGGTMIDTRDANEMSSIHTILMETDIKSLQVYITDATMCNAMGNYRRTLLHMAAALGSHEHMNFLVGFDGIELNPVDHFGKYPIHYACEIGNLDLIKNIVEHGGRIDYLDGTKKSVLHIASVYGHSDLVEWFIKEGVDPYLLDQENRNCLHYAVMYRNADIVRLLLEWCGYDGLSCADSNGRTPIDYLHGCEKVSLISRYIKNEADGVDILALETDPSPVAGTRSKIGEISGEPYIGSVHAIPGHDMDRFIERVRDSVRKVVCSAIGSDAIEVIGVGSSFEGTKNGLPDELDFLIRLFPTQTDDSQQEGYGKMKREKWVVKELKIVGSYGLWMWGKLMAYWSERIDKGEIILQLGHCRFEMTLPPQRHPDSKTCTTWTWLYSDRNFTDLPVSIDLVPALEAHISERKLKYTWAITNDEMRDECCYIVPKIPHEQSPISSSLKTDDLNQLGRVSYPTLEVKHLHALDQRTRDVYITAKCLRKPEVCGFKIKNAEGEVKPGNDYITSYRLKTSFLHLVPLFLKSKLSFGKMVLMVYELLEKCLARGKLPMFFDPEVNILAGSKIDLGESVKATRMMTRFVRAVYERDCSADMERDSREEERVLAEVKVYNANYHDHVRAWEQTEYCEYEKKMLEYQRELRRAADVYEEYELKKRIRELERQEPKKPEPLIHPFHLLDRF